MGDLHGKPYITHQFGVVGPYGNIWTPDTFETPEAAAKHVSDFWGGHPEKLKGYQIVAVEVEVRDISGPTLPATPISDLLPECSA